MRRYLKSCDGASAAEYALLLGIIGALLAITLFIFGGAVAEQMDAATNMVTPGGSGGGSRGGNPGIGDGVGGGRGH